MKGSLPSLAIWPTWAAAAAMVLSVGGGVAGVDLACHRLDDALDLVGARDGVTVVREAGLVAGSFGHLDLQLRVRLGGAVKHAHVLGVGQDLLEHVDLVVNRVHVGGAGEVSAGLVVVGDEAGGGVVGDGGAHDGDVARRGGYGLGGRRGDDVDQVVAVARELGGDGGTGALVVVGVLLVDRVLDARLVEGLDEALVGGIEGGVLRELQDADLVGLLAGVVGRAGVGSAARGEHEQGRAGGAGDERAPRDGVHGSPSFLRALPRAGLRRAAPGCASLVVAAILSVEYAC